MGNREWGIVELYNLEIRILDCILNEVGYNFKYGRIEVIF